MKKISPQDQQLFNKTKLAAETFRDFALGILKGDPAFSTEELETKRLSICSSCPNMIKNRCSVCGCNMKMKVKLAEAKCPKGFWEEKLIEEAIFGEASKQYVERSCCNGR